MLVLPKKTGDQILMLFARSQSLNSYLSLFLPIYPYYSPKKSGCKKEKQRKSSMTHSGSGKNAGGGAKTRGMVVRGGPDRE